MNHRERVLTALNHQEPDRVPIDFGGTVDSSISALSYQALRERLELGKNITRVLDIHQQTALIDDDVREKLDVDTSPLFYEPREWREDRLKDGSLVLFPEKFRPREEENGSQVIMNSEGIVTLRMPKDGYYFDSVYSPLRSATSVKEIEKYRQEIECYDRPSYLDKSYEELAEKAKTLLENTDYCLVGFFGGHIFQACQSLRGWEQFLVDLVENQKFAEALLERVTEANIQRFEHYARTVAQYVHLIHFEDDLGMQDRPLLSPKLYRKLIKPYQSRLFSFVKSRTKALILYHSDGAIYPFIPDFIEMGVDVLNPIQVSARGMETKKLKKEFGKDISFWGAGCESQTILPFASAEKVADEVKHRLDDLAPGGGFIFSPIHNIQAEVPVENVVTMFNTAREYGVY